MAEIYFHYYPARVESKKAIGVITLQQLANAIKNPSDKIKNIFNQISEAASAGDLKRKDFLKQNNLFYFTPCIYTDGAGRGYANILAWTGIAVIEFDKIQNAEKLRDYIFDKYKSVICAFVSPSKKGAKFLFKIPFCFSVDEFKSYYYGLGVEFEKFKGWDPSAQNCALPLFLSWDPELRFREDATTWNKRGTMPGSFKSGPVRPAVIVDASDKDRAFILSNIKKAVDAISDNGHPQLRAAGISLGGYVGAGYLSEHEALEFITALIYSNSYLMKGPKGYILTSKTGIKKGATQPIYLKKHRQTK